MEAVVFISMALALAVTSWFWGADSREKFDSLELARRKEWYSKVS